MITKKLLTVQLYTTFQMIFVDIYVHRPKAGYARNPVICYLLIVNRVRQLI